MPDCSSIDPFVTPYVDGELPDTDRARVDEHLQCCRSCCARVAGERAVRAVIRQHRADLERDSASPALRRSCAELARSADAETAKSRGERAAPQSRLARWRPMALAATLVLLVGGAFLYMLTDSSARLMAAELTADHVKCFAMNRVLPLAAEPGAVRSSMATRFGWMLRLPEHPERAGLELVGARPCLYGEGRVAHLMYRHHGVPVSIFMLPGSVRPQEVVDVMGHEAVVWSSGSRTFVLIAREPRAEVQQMASFVQASLQ